MNYWIQPRHQFKLVIALAKGAESLSLGSKYVRDWGLSHLSSWVAKGWVSRGFPVILWYSLAAASNIAVNLSANREGPPTLLMVDMGRELSEEIGRGDGRE